MSDWITCPKSWIFWLVQRFPLMQKSSNETIFTSNKKFRDSELVKPCGEQLKSRVWNEIICYLIDSKVQSASELLMWFQKFSPHYNTLWVSRVLKYPKKYLEDMTTFFMSNWWGDSKNMEKVEFSPWLFEGRLRQGKNVLPEGLNWLCFCR